MIAEGTDVLYVGTGSGYGCALLTSRSQRQAAGVVAGLLGRPVEVAEPPPGQANPLSAWLEHTGPAVDIAALRRRYPQIGWHSFADWAATQDWYQLMPPGYPRS